MRRRMVLSKHPAGNMDACSVYRSTPRHRSTCLTPYACSPTGNPAYVIVSKSSVLHHCQRSLQDAQASALILDLLDGGQRRDDDGTAVGRHAIICPKLLKRAQSNADELACLHLTCLNEGLQQLLHT